MPRITDRIRTLTAEQLGVIVQARSERAESTAGTLADLAKQDDIALAVLHALNDGFGAILLVGPPGTSKTYYAQRLAARIAGNSDYCRYTQFHASYQYEDFVEGWMPTAGGGFSLEPKHFSLACDEAIKCAPNNYVLVIDEVSRCDAARVFGEALTYLEMTKRGLRFRLASGRETSVPSNLVIIATMNPWDRGVDEMDAALLRRFAQIRMPPDSQILERILLQNGLIPKAIAAACNFLDGLLKERNEFVHIGHAYFNGVKDVDGMLRLWNFQLEPHFRLMTRQDTEAFRRIEALWQRTVATALAETDPATDEDGVNEDIQNPESEASSTKIQNSNE